MEEAKRQASIRACNEKRNFRRKKLQEDLVRIEDERLKQLYNLTKEMVFVFLELNGIIVVLAIVDPSWIRSSSSKPNNPHIVYGDPEYRLLSMKASYNTCGDRSEITDVKSYTVSTSDGITFNVIDIEENVFSFTTFVKYESLVGQIVSGVQFDQFWYSPSKVVSDSETAKFHAELDMLVEADAEHVRRNPKLLEDGYILYHRS